MSIIDLSKIGELIKKEQSRLMLVLGFILVAAIAFGAGRLSSPTIIRNPIVIDEPNASTSYNFFSDVSQPVINPIGETIKTQNEKGLFVASKNSNLYHWPWCAPAKRIKLENQIWFKNEAQAKAAGYSPSSCIASEAPAGYKSQ